MRANINLVDKVEVKAPCSASWEQMEGDERMRYCQGCQLHVHNLSALTRREAETLLQTQEGRLCVRYAQNADGKVIIDNCPPRLRPARALLHKNWSMLTSVGLLVVKQCAAVASFGLLLLNFTSRAVGAAPQTDAKPSGNASDEKNAKTKIARNTKSTQAVVPSRVIMGRRAFHQKPTTSNSDSEKAVMGDIAAVIPTKTQGKATMTGKVPTKTTTQNKQAKAVISTNSDKKNNKSKDTTVTQTIGVITPPSLK